MVRKYYKSNNDYQLALDHEKIFPKSKDFILKLEKLTTKFLRRSFQKPIFSVISYNVVVLQKFPESVGFVPHSHFFFEIILEEY